MTTALYAALATFLIIWLSLNVIKLRHKKKVSIGDADDLELRTAMAAQANALEYLPIALLLLFALEYNGAYWWLIHPVAIALMAGRLIHARAMLTENLNQRVLGMKITIWSLITLAVLNLLFLPYSTLFS